MEEDIVITMAKRSFQEGPPLKKNVVHCEVNGSRKEIPSIGQFHEEQPGVPISIEGCYQRGKVSQAVP